MARRESDREDLFEEFRSAVAKWELSVPGFDEHVVCGIRKDGRVSIYFGPDPVYHFDAENRLLRAYCDGFLYRTQGTTLAQLKRRRSETETSLIRHDLDVLQLQTFTGQCREKLSHLLATIQERQCVVIRREPLELEFARLSDCLEKILTESLQLANAYPTRK